MIFSQLSRGGTTNRNWKLFPGMTMARKKRYQRKTLTLRYRKYLLVSQPEVLFKCNASFYCQRPFKTTGHCHCKRWSYRPHADNQSINHLFRHEAQRSIEIPQGNQTNCLTAVCYIAFWKWMYEIYWMVRRIVKIVTKSMNKYLVNKHKFTFLLCTVVFVAQNGEFKWFEGFCFCCLTSNYNGMGGK